MKKLSSVSPFLLLLFPVFIMMLLAFATSSVTLTDEGVAAKNTANTGNPIVKGTVAILK